MADKPDSSPSPPDESVSPGNLLVEEERQEDAEMPMTMAASIVLSSLSKDTASALKNAGELAQAKVRVRFKPIGSAPALQQPIRLVDSKQRFAYIMVKLRHFLGMKPTESIYCYVNSVFSPGLDENVGNLWRCFKAGDELVINYAKMPAFG